MNAADLLIKALENQGAEVIYGVPGEGNLDQGSPGADLANHLKQKASDPI